MKSFWIVAVGGAAGTLSRYGVAEGLHSDTFFPCATFLVNITGSFLLGAVLAALIVRADDHGHRRTTRLLVGTGFLGGYTTFSAASLETAGLVLDRRPLAAAVNGLGVLVACVAAAACGYALVGI